MKTIPNRIIAPGPGDIEKAADAFTLICERFVAQPTPPPCLIGDLVLALLRPRPSLREVELFPGYFTFLRRLTRSPRWGFVVTRLGQLGRQPRASRVWNSIIVQIIESVVTSLWRIGAVAPGSALSEEALLEQVAAAYEQADADSPHQDFSALLLDDPAMALIELMRRARALGFKELLQPRDLIQACLDAPIDSNTYRPRLLCETMREGARRPRLPGEHQDLRAITVKVREEHIPRILPSELAANHWRGRLGRTFTLDKVINRSPAIWQHHEMQRPELEHRILIVLLMSVPRHPAAGFADPAEISAKALGFSLLINAALKLPHELIAADVAWFQRDDPEADAFQWAVQFPLGALRPTGAEGERWRNVVELDRYLPRLLAAFGGGVDVPTQAEYVLIREHPLDYLTRACHGRYHGVFLVGIAPPGEAASLVPAPSLALPPLPAGVPPVMLVTAGPEARRGLRGATFPSLLAARMTPAVLPPTPPEAEPATFLVGEFLKMVIGPVARPTGAPRAGFPEVRP